MAHHRPSSPLGAMCSNSRLLMSLAKTQSTTSWYRCIEWTYRAAAHEHELRGSGSGWTDRGVGHRARNRLCSSFDFVQIACRRGKPVLPYLLVGVSENCAAKFSPTAFRTSVHRRPRGSPRSRTSVLDAVQLTFQPHEPDPTCSACGAAQSQWSEWTAGTRRRGCKVFSLA